VSPLSLRRKKKTCLGPMPKHRSARGLAVRGLGLPSFSWTRPRVTSSFRTFEETMGSYPTSTVLAASQGHPLQSWRRWWPMATKRRRPPLCPSMTTDAPAPVATSNAATLVISRPHQGTSATQTRAPRPHLTGALWPSGPHPPPSIVGLHSDRATGVRNNMVFK